MHIFIRTLCHHTPHTAQAMLLKTFFEHWWDLQLDCALVCDFLMWQNFSTSWHHALQTGCNWNEFLCVL